MATVHEPPSGSRKPSSSDAAVSVCVLLLIAAGLLWVWLPAKQLPPPNPNSRGGELVETVPGASKADSAAARDGNPDELVGQQDRPGAVPHVRLSRTSDAAGLLHGTVHNDTGRGIDRLRLRITTAKWGDRAFDVYVKVGNNATASFSFFVGETGMRVESFRVVGPNG